MTTKYIEVPAAALSAGLPVNYEAAVNGRKVMTTGTVLKIRRTGEFQIEITLRHRKTGRTHINTMDARHPVYVYAAFLQDDYIQEVQAGLPWEGLADIWTEGLVEQLRKKLDGNMWDFSGMPIES